LKLLRKKESELQVPIEAIKELRDRTGAGIMECKKTLIEADGDIDNAIAILRERGLALAQKKAERVTQEGLIEAYIHSGRIGALVELNCETDFVARTGEFKQLAHLLAMQVVATDPKFISAKEAPDGENPEEVCLLSQPFIKEPQKKVEDIITEARAKLGENIRVRRFARFQLGE
jgi:elongation factor Ts